ncbi:tape measure protein [uncultured Sunxiuqinia sp.]|uniref:tape measure protein n=1 Tax=uncultured Sunxiuqinia sp. TaxID=1573825 RepID=UPI002AA69913|nr:tape measure protein [uncultured Sunxiuqinia sp.]
MSGNTIPVDIEFVLKNMNFQEEAGKMKKGIQGVTTTARQEADKIQTIYKQMAAGIGVYFSARFLKEFVTSIAQVRGEFQQLEVSLETILKSKTEADRLMQQVVNFAATTPFELKDVATGTKQLLAYGFAASETVDTMRLLGNVAAGVSAPIGDIIYLYGTLRTQGRAYTRDILQFTSRGIPIIGQLADQFGVAESEVQKLVEAGKVGFKDVETAFKSLTDESGIFNNLIEKQSKTITGLYSNFQDAIDVALNGLGEANEGTIADAIKGATTLVENYDKVVDVLQVLATTYGAYKAATIAVAVAENFRATSTVTQMVSNGIKMVAVTRQLTLAQWLQVKSTAALNAVMAINPYVLAATAIAGLVTILSVFGKEAKQVEDYVSELNSSIDRIGKQEEIDQLINQYETLSGKANRTADEQKTLNSSIQELGTIFPDAISKTDEYGKAVDLVAEKIRDLNKELRDNLITTTTAEIEDSERKIRKLQEQQANLLNEANSGQTDKRTFVTTKGGSAGYIENEVIGLSPEEIKKKRDEVKKLSGDINLLQETLQKGRTKLTALNAADANEILTPYKDLFQQASDYSREQALQVKADLVALLGAGLGVNADQRIKEQIQAVDTQLGLPTIKKQIAETTTALAEAQAKLVALRADSSQATAKQIEDQKKLVDDLAARLETLTGVKQKKEKELTTLKQQIDKLYKDLETADAKDRDIIAARIVKLEKEKQLREEIANQAVKVANNDLLNPKTASSDSIRGTLKDGEGRPLFIGKGEIDNAKKLDLEFDKLNKRIINTREEGTSYLLYDLTQMSAAAASITDQFAEQLGLNEDQAQVLKDGFQAVNGIANIASGNVIQGAAQLVSASLSMFFQAPEKLADHFKAVQEQIDAMLSSIDIATQSLANMGSSAVSQSLFSIQRRMSDLADEAKRLNDELGGASYGRRRSPSYVGFYGDLVNEATSLTDEIQALSERLIGGNVSNDQREAIEAVLSSYNALMAQIDTITQEVTGTTVQSLADSLADVFLSGEDAAVAWGEKVDEVIKNVIVKQLTADLLTAPIQDAVKQLVKDSTDGERTGRGGSGEEINIGLTPEEAANFRESVQDIYDSAQPAFQAMIDSFSEYGFDFGSATNSKGLTGAIKGITEETAGLIAGHLTGLRFDVRAIVAQIAAGQEDTVQRIGYLKQIADNTQYNKHLVEIKDEMIGMHRTLRDGI